MSTDRFSMECDVFVINAAGHRHQPNVVNVFESKPGRWMPTSSMPPPCSYFPNDKIEHECVSIFVKAEFYRLFVFSDPRYGGIVSYNRVTGAVSDLILVTIHSVHVVDFSWWSAKTGYFAPPVLESNFQLATSSVISTWKSAREEFQDAYRDLFQACRIEISEIDIAGKECKRLAEMPSDLLKWIQGHNEVGLVSTMLAPV